MTSGQTEYTKEQMLTMLAGYLKEASAKYLKANREFIDANDKIRDKLQKHGIGLTEFVAFTRKETT